MVCEIFLENPIYIVVIALWGAMIFFTKINEKNGKYRVWLAMIRSSYFPF